MAVKGQMFSLIALVMSLFFIMLFSSVGRAPLDSDLPRIKTQIDSVNNVVVDLEEHIGNSIDSSTYQILNFSASYLNGTNYFPDFFTFFKSCFETGVFFDTYDARTKLCSVFGHNVSFNFLLGKTLNIASSVHKLNLNATFVDTSVGMFDAYALEINATVYLDISSVADSEPFSWHRTLLISREVNFNGITDPASVGTDFVRKIRYRQDKRSFARSGFNGNLNLISLYINHSYYYLDPSGTSFVDRMEGRHISSFDLNDSNPLGIATLLPAYNQSAGSLFRPNASMVDHHYDWGSKISPEFLRIVDDPSISENITLYRTYAEQGLGIDPALLLSASVYCDEDGCTRP